MLSFLFVALAQVSAPVPSAPSLGLWHELVYFARTETLVLLNGGPEQGKPDSDPLELWSWNGQTWARLPHEGPRWRNQASVTVDTRRGVLVLYGGIRGEEELADTWEWNGQRWSRHEVEGPGPREAAGLTFDASHGVCVLFGGASRGAPQGDTWTWNGTAWTKVATHGPSPRFPAGLAYDEVHEVVLLFGGHAIDARGFRTFGDTWLWDGESWESLELAGPSARDGARAVFMPGASEVWLFGGAEVGAGVRHLDDLWTFDGVAWSEREERGPPGRVHAAMAFDVKRGRLVLAGGSDAPAKVRADVWEHDGERWHCVHAGT